MTELSPRKEPQQQRSKLTVEAIVEACAQLLAELGYHGLSTNKIAERAGVSVGSLYQYFPNKEAIVAAVVERFAKRQFAVLARDLEAFADAPLADGIRHLMRNMFEAKLIEPELSRVLFSELPQVGQLDVHREWTDQACAVVRMALASRDEAELRDVDLDHAAFLLVSACHGITQNAVLNRPALLDDHAFIAETAELVVRYLAPPEARKAVERPPE